MEKNVVTYESVKHQTTEEYFKNNQFAIDAFNSKYVLFKGETYVQAIKRVCDFIAEAEETTEVKKYWSERWFDEIYNDWWHPAGSIMQGAASGRNVSLCNCTTVSLGSGKNDEEWDNLESIIKNTAYTIAKAAAFRQGIGVDFSRLRPVGTSVKNSANASSGATHWMKFIDSIGYYVGQCLHPDSRILTPNGYLTIKHIVDNKIKTKVVTPNGNKDIINWFKNPTKKIFKLTTQYGDVLRLSEDHEIATPDKKGIKKKKLKDLKIGDFLVSVRPNKFAEADYIPITNFEYEVSTYNNSNRLSIPTKLPNIINEDLAYLAGQIYGDGCETNESIEISISNDWPRIKEKINNCLKTCFDLNIGDYGIGCRAGDGDCEKINLGRFFTKFLRHCGFSKQKAGKMIFPEIIKKSPSSVLFSFFDGFFDADGHNSKTRRNIDLISKDYEFLYDMKLELAKYGIVINLRPKKLYYRFSVVGKRSIIKLSNLSKSIKINEGNLYGKYDRLKIPFTAQHLGIKHNKFKDINCGDFLSDIKYEKYKNEICNLYIQKIKSIEYDDTIETYDITVNDENHLFLAENILVSNSGRVPAMLFSLSCDHPDIEEFINLKEDYNKIQNANISVHCTEAFYKAVEKDKDWQLIFTIPEVKKGQKVYLDAHSTDKDSLYDKEQKKYYYLARKDRKEEKIVKIVKAKYLLELIAKNMSKYAEPGIQNIDIARKYSNSDYVYDPEDDYDSRIISTNACSEQYLSRDALCVLSSANVGIFSTNPEEYEQQLQKVGESLVRFLDNVNTMEVKSGTYATPFQKMSIEKLRRIGAGYTNIAGWLFKQGLEYGTPEGNEAIGEFTKRYNYYLYKYSIELGKEKGSFGLFNREKFESSPFVKRMMKLGLEFEAMRNCNCSSIGPTGTLSLMFRDLVLSYGIEPAFGIYFWKRTRISGHYEYYFCVPYVVRETFKKHGLEIPMDSDTIKDTWDGKYGTPIAEFIDQNLKKIGINFHRSTFVKPMDKLDLMSQVMKHIDSSISVTYMLPENSKWRDIYEFILAAYKKEVKSIATFPDRKMYGIISYVPFKSLATKLISEGLNIHDQNFTKKEHSELEEYFGISPHSADIGQISKTKAPTRPRSLQCDIHHIKVTKKLDKVRTFDYLVMVGLLGGDPYEVFVMENGFVPKKDVVGTITKVKSGVYSLRFEDGNTIDDVTKDATQEEDIFTRLISTSLRHGADILYVVEQLEKSEGDLCCLSKAISRALKKYIKNGTKVNGKCPECGGNELMRNEGCIACSCGWSKCG